MAQEYGCRAVPVDPFAKYLPCRRGRVVEFRVLPFPASSSAPSKAPSANPAPFALPIPARSTSRRCGVQNFRQRSSLSSCSALSTTNEVTPRHGSRSSGLFQRVELPSQAQVAVHGFGGGVGRREEEHLRRFRSSSIRRLRRPRPAPDGVRCSSGASCSLSKPMRLKKKEAYRREPEYRRHRHAAAVGAHTGEPPTPRARPTLPPRSSLRIRWGQQDEAEQRRSDQCPAKRRAPKSAQQLRVGESSPAKAPMVVMLPIVSG